MREIWQVKTILKPIFHSGGKDGESKEHQNQYFFLGQNIK